MAVPHQPINPCLELVHEFNELFIQQVADLARQDDGHTLPEMVRVHRDLWVSLDGPARQRASQCPFLLVDLQFRNIPWWRCAQSDPAWHGGPSSSVRLFGRKAAIELTRDALLVACYSARLDTRLATTFFAMSPGVARVIAQLGLRHVRRIPDHCHQHLHPRWQHLSSFWGRLLGAAMRDDREALYDLHLHAFQLADGENGAAGSSSDPGAGIPDR